MLGLAKYPGGKQRVAQRILRCLPPSFTSYVEPFCGNSPFLQPQFRHYLNPARKKIWLNDLCFDVVNVLRALKDAPETFIDGILARKNRCENLDDTIREFEQAKVDLRSNDDPTAYLFLRRLAVNQIVRRNRSNLCSISPKYAAPVRDGNSRNGLLAVNRDRLQTAAGIAQQVYKVTCIDFREVLTALPDDCAVYLDPPYWTSRIVEWYDHSFTQQDHFDLADLLYSLDPANHRFLLSLEISELSRHLYILPGVLYWKTLEVPYSTPRNGSKRVRELLIGNYRF